MRSIWKGSISFGLVNIPIKVFGATESHSVSFRQVHASDGGRIRYRKVCELEDQEVPNEEITKAFEAPDGTMVQLTDEDLESLPLPTAKTIDILAFVPADSIDPLQLDRSYYLAADGSGAAKPYVLLREALNRSEKVAVAKLALRGRETLGMVRVVDDALAMHTMLWPDEIRQPVGVAPDTNVKVRDAELDLADTLMATLGELDIEELHDEYREAVEALVAAKLEGTEPEPAGVRPEGGGRVIDLMAALEKSVKAVQEGREEGEGAEVTQMRAAKPPARAAQKTAAKPAVKSGAAKSAGTKKAAAKKAPARKTTAKKSTTAKSTAKSTAKKAPAKKTAAKKRAS
ncbi:Ku protein [Streptomyces pathocidini]|uniref:Non-homologous end joining protein Ku n=1 Tax=Streptomyces pathocidini TaxID=1650571 RepID=A0ABW7URL0_9ACTN|nr:Ku protein [Streptomyces pathocidini]